MMTQKTKNKALIKNRKIAETGIFLALFLGLAYSFHAIPNLEFITLTAFLAGLLLGWKRGLFVALLGEAIFSIANPFGSSLAFPSLLLAQLLGFSLIAISGALSRLFLPSILKKSKVVAALILGAQGLLLTLIYNLLTTLSFTLVSGYDFKQTLATFISGIPFYLVNLISNTLSFAVLIVLVLHYVLRHYPHYLEGRK